MATNIVIIHKGYEKGNKVVGNKTLEDRNHQSNRMLRI